MTKKVLVWYSQISKKHNQKKITYNGQERALMEKVYGVLVMTLLEMLQFLMFIIVHHLILTTNKKFLVLVGGSTNGINGSAGAAEEKY